MTEGNISFEALSGFDMSVRYVDGVVEPARALGPHTHAECEIYIHLGGDVSFMVEDRLYPIKYGNVVITRPNEYHHCIYHKTTTHRHIWILFSGTGNEKILEMFFKRKKGSGNLLSLTADETLEITALCEKLCKTPKSETEKYFLFFKMLCIMESAEEITKERTVIQNEVSAALRNIHKNYAEKLTVKSLAENAHISISTLERRFTEALGTTPSKYIKSVRLENAARLLAMQSSVTEAAEKSGFSDVSAMIELFKKRYGETPLQYKRRRLKEEKQR